MSMMTINPGISLSFDDTRESDIIELVDKLRYSKKLGKFVSDLIRVAWDNPEILDKTTGSIKQGEILKQISDNGMSGNRSKFFNEANKEIIEMRDKINKIYELAFSQYMLAQLGKTLELEHKAENQLSATFILQKQLNELSKALGNQVTSLGFESNDITVSNTKKLAENSLEYIINTYDGIINELKNQIQQPQQPQVVIQPQSQPQPQVQVQEVQQVEVQTQPQVMQPQPVKPIVQQTNEKVVQPVVPEETDEDDEILDFGDTDTVNFEDADMAALDNFFGD